MRLSGLAALAALCVGAGSAAAQPLTSAPDGRASAFASAGYFWGDGQWDAGDGHGPSSTLTVRAGGEVPVVRRPARVGVTGLSAVLGVAVQAAESRVGRSFRSGFRPQSAEVYGRLAGGLGRTDVAGTVGFVIDMGTDFETDVDGVIGAQGIPNSDRQNALRLGADVGTPVGRVGRVRLLAGAQGVLTFRRTAAEGLSLWPGGEAEDYVTDDGDYLTGYAGVSAALGAGVEAGVRVVGVRRARQYFSDAYYGGAPGCGDGTCDYSYERWVTSVVPHVRFAPPGSAVEVSLTGEATGGFSGEHTRYGFGVTGRAEPKVLIPITLAARVAF